MTAAAGVTKAQGAVMATSPPSRPLQTMPRSGLRTVYQTKTSAANAPGRRGEHGVDRDQGDARVWPPASSRR